MVNESYVDANTLDADVVVGSVISGMLAFAEKPSYPFLTELSEVTGRPPTGVPEGLEDLWRVWVLFQEKWPEVDPQLLSEAALRSMMASLGDPVSRYLTPEAYDRSQEAETTRYEGIGAVIGVENGLLTILSPMSGGPAERAGMQQGDVILEVDGMAVEGKTLEEATTEVKGATGTRVTFLIQRPSESEPREISITRGTIDVPTVDMSLLPSSVGYLYIEEFQPHTLDEVLDFLEVFNQLDTLGVILDLRGNQDGSLEVAQSVAAQFIPEGLFLYQVDGNEVRIDMSIVDGGNLVEGSTIVALVNEGTAEAAEALAGALQDAGRATLVGATTRGRGSTNAYHKLSSGGAIYLPEAFWYTPSGRSISAEGIVPDIEASLSPEDLVLGRDSQLIEAYEYLDTQLPAFR